MDPYHQARAIMEKFTISSGLAPGVINDDLKTSHRYLWTDAFAVCNYLILYQQSAEPYFLHLALNLVDQVHLVLGQYHPDSANRGWLSGLDNEQALQHPTIAGLRIGKPLPERQANEALVQSLEWDRDGQYFHYLTKWMHALYCVSHVTGKHVYHFWAMELAKTANAAFTSAPSINGRKRMYWKMSTDLQRPLVTSMGQHDPLDGLITYLQLHTSSKHLTDMPAKISLETEIKEMTDICDYQHWASSDPLAIGGLLIDAYRLFELVGTEQLNEQGRLLNLLADIDTSLNEFIVHMPPNQSAAHRLPFRELGLAIGLQAIPAMLYQLEQNKTVFKQHDPLVALLTKLKRFTSMHTDIIDFWSAPEHQGLSTWQDHANINNMMMATCLLSDGYLRLN